MSDYVFPVADATSWWKNRPYRLNRTQAWPVDDPFVKANPDLFRADPSIVSSSVEQATAAPGEKRATTTRRRKTSPNK